MKLGKAFYSTAKSFPKQEKKQVMFGAVCWNIRHHNSCYCMLDKNYSSQADFPKETSLKGLVGKKEFLAVMMENTLSALA